MKVEIKGNKKFWTFCFLLMASGIASFWNGYQSNWWFMGIGLSLIYISMLMIMGFFKKGHNFMEMRHETER